MNNYLKGKLLFKLNINEFLKKKTETGKINFGKANFFSFKFIKFLILLLINLKFVTFVKIFIATILNYYNQFVFMESNLKLVGHAFIQNRKKKYFFMDKNDSMLGEIYVNKIFRNKNLATLMSLFLLNRTYNHYQDIFYVCDKDNIASIRLAIKCGFESCEY
tara:strand:+ start:352 stop:837 length:486 start_codon:yes stop_codon:yes gene_type:complete